MNDLERQLRAWVPRRPSAKLKAQTFCAAPAAVGDQVDHLTPEASHLTAHHSLAWLAPATAALLFVAMLFNQRTGAGFSASDNSSPMVAVALSNQSAAAWLPGSFSRDVNSLPAETFKWTNGSSSTSSISSPLGRRGKN